ncbi:hypothetical protein G9A89_001201 [Geosiphon pyriformis]|nr:hypothetical protein G9A89_001201 [Geosiphon pyriformis]
MDFTELYKQSLYLSQFSPNGQFLATAYRNKLVIRDSNTLEVIVIHTSAEIIQSIAWSPDSELLLAGCFKSGAVYIWGVYDEEWNAKIEEGTVGLTNAKWSPDGRSVLCFSDFQRHVTFNSRNILKKVNRETSFLDGKYFILAERRDGKDYIGIYDCNNAWRLLKHFVVDTVDLENLAWSPDGRYIAVWDNRIDYRVLIYTPDGRCQKSYSAYEMELGVKTATWAPSSQFLAVSSYDQKIRFLNHYNWSPTIEFLHTSPVNDIPDLTILREVSEGESKDYGRSIIKYVIQDQPIELLSIRPDPEKPNPRLGVGLCKFNANGTLVASRNDNMPNCLWIWDISMLKPIVLFIQLMPIKNFHWNPQDPHQLVLFCGSEYLYLWSGEEIGAEIIQVPQVNFLVNNLRWNPSGQSLLLMDKEVFCVSFFVNEDNESYGEGDISSVLTHY